MLLWVDIETTGLVPALGEILEVGLVITGDRLEFIDNFDIIVKPSNSQLLHDLPALVHEMHEKSGLLSDCMNIGVRAEEAERTLLSWLQNHPSTKGLPMCGSSVGFDRSWLEYHMGNLAAWWGYRTVDVSSIKELTRRWAPERVFLEPFEKKTHRPLNDLRYSLDEARHYMNEFFS